MGDANDAANMSPGEMRRYLNNQPGLLLQEVSEGSASFALDLYRAGVPLDSLARFYQFAFTDGATAEHGGREC